MSRTRGVPTSCPVPCRSARHPARWRRYASIALRTREPALKRGERVDQLMGLEGAVARPMLTCTSTPASTRRSIARLVAWNDRPTSSDAVDVGSTGAAGRASIRRLTAESRQMRPTRPRQPDCSSRTRSSKLPASSTDRLHAEAKSAIQLLMPALDPAELDGATWRVPFSPSM